MTRGTARSCVGCLGTRACWVCDGTGIATGFSPVSSASRQCHRCGGTGVCSLCPPAMPEQRPASGSR